MTSDEYIIETFGLSADSACAGWNSDAIGAITQGLKEKIALGGRDVEQCVAMLFLDRINSNVWSDLSISKSAFCDILLNCYAEKQANVAKKSPIFIKLVDDILGDKKNVVSGDLFKKRIEKFCKNSPCSISHNIFKSMDDANKEQLAEYMWAENLCDLTFVHILGFLMQGVFGSSGIEIANNYYDEIGNADEERFHIKLRKNMMKNVGLPSVDEGWKFDSYDTFELIHFNTYCANGFKKELRMRLIGMMYATEFLVPPQLERAITCWKRVGLSDDELEYMLIHVIGDVEHSEGWANEVVIPLVDGNRELQEQILLGVSQHVEILTKLYDRLNETIFLKGRRPSISYNMRLE